jgi:predicted methyltransferase
MHMAGRAFADKSFPTGKAAIQAAMKGTHRMVGNAERDKYRHPAETLDFFGFKPTMTVIDVSPGEGWYTELVAPVLAKKGQYYATTADPNGPSDMRGTFYAQQFKALVDKAPELYGKAQVITIDPKAPSLGKDGSVDLVLVMRELHGMKNNSTLDAWLSEILRALKPGGVLGVEEHRAKPDADPTESAKKGYLPEKWVIDTITAAGFKLAAKSEINANPKDTKDYEKGVWTLPPSFELGATDHDKYAAIGESDRMTLKFVKPAAKAAPKTAPAPKK